MVCRQFALCTLLACVHLPQSFEKLAEQLCPATAAAGRSFPGNTVLRPCLKLLQGHSDSDEAMACMAGAGEGGVVEVEGGGRHMRVSARIPHALTLRAAAASPTREGGEQQRPVVEDGGQVSVVDMMLPRMTKVVIERLQLRHTGGRFEIEDNPDTAAAGNGELGGCCCVGVDGGDLVLADCVVSAVNGSCVGATGVNSSALVRRCEFGNSSVGLVACAGAQIRCEDATMQGHDQAGLVLMGNSTLAELEGCMLSDCGVMGASLTSGARLVADGCSFLSNNQSGVGLSGRGGWARLRSCTLSDNGEHGILAAAEANAQVEECRIKGHEYGVSCFDHGSSVWVHGNDLSDNTNKSMYAGVGGVIEWTGGDLKGPARTPTPERNFEDPDEGKGEQGAAKAAETASVKDQMGGDLLFECEDLGKSVVLSESEEESKDNSVKRGADAALDGGGGFPSEHPIKRLRKDETSNVEP